MSFTSLLPRIGLLAAALFCFAAAPVRGADQQVAGQLAYTIAVPAGKLTVQQVHDIVMAAAVGRAWGVKEDAKDRIVIYLNHRKNEATVTFLITENDISAYCEGYATDGKGNRKGPEQPKGWLKYLHEDITKGLNKAAFVEKK
jgi:hypothetical protein